MDKPTTDIDERIEQLECDNKELRSALRVLSGAASAAIDSEVDLARVPGSPAQPEPAAAQATLDLVAVTDRIGALERQMERVSNTMTMIEVAAKMAANETSGGPCSPMFSVGQDDLAPFAKRAAARRARAELLRVEAQALGAEHSADHQAICDMFPNTPAGDAGSDRAASLGGVLDDFEAIDAIGGINI